MAKLSQLEKYYGKFHEENRLGTRHGRVEFEVSMSKILEFIEQIRENRENHQIRILDVGAGTGRYSVALSHKGFDVTAVELTKHNFEILRAKHEKVKCWQGDAQNLHFLENRTFDLTLVFGPMYHLHTQEERLCALNEAERVTKSGGFILVAYVMNDYAILTYCFREKHILESLKNGTISEDFHALTTKENDLFSYVRLEDVENLDAKTNLKRFGAFAPDGAADYFRKELNALSEDEFEQFVRYQKTICERKELLGASSHIVDVLRVK